MGYDISDYLDIDPKFADLQTLKKLIKHLHENNIKLIVDLAVNRSSSEHHRFKASCDPKHPKHKKYKNFYIWQKKKNSLTSKHLHWCDKRGEYFFEAWCINPT